MNSFHLTLSGGRLDHPADQCSGCAPDSHPPAPHCQEAAEIIRLTNAAAAAKLLADNNLLEEALSVLLGKQQVCTSVQGDIGQGICSRCVLVLYRGILYRCGRWTRA